MQTASGREIECAMVTLRYGTEAPVLNRINLRVAACERIAVLGESGSGKTSLLRCIAGLTPPVEGEIRFDGRPAKGCPPHRRGISMVAQSHSLFPHWTVRQNLEAGLDGPRGGKTAEVDAVVRRLRLEGLMDRRPGELSGGQRSRVSLGAVLLEDRPIRLFDEPFNGLDAQLRLAMRELLLELHAERPRTTIFVSHDPTDAAAIGERVAVMSRGELVECAPLARLLDDPEDLRTLTALRASTINAFVGNVAGEALIRPGDGESIAIEPGLDGRPVVALWRSEDLRIESAFGDDECRGEVVRIEGVGPDRTIVVRTRLGALRVHLPRGAEMPQGAISVRWRKSDLLLFDATTHRRIRRL